MCDLMSAFILRVYYVILYAINIVCSTLLLRVCAF
jgi:hypothetical protein